jgi:hypothetical protein
LPARGALFAGLALVFLALRGHVCRAANVLTLAVPEMRKV